MSNHFIAGGKLHIRTDSRLHSLLRELHELAHAEVAPHLFDALEMMGSQSPYKGGRRLLDQLDFIKREAESLADQVTAEGAHDAVAYATGKLLDGDLREKYNLYNDSARTNNGFWKASSAQRAR